MIKIIKTMLNLSQIDCSCGPGSAKGPFPDLVTVPISEEDTQGFHHHRHHHRHHHQRLSISVSIVIIIGLILAILNLMIREPRVYRPVLISVVIIINAIITIVIIASQSSVSSLSSLSVLSWPL